MKKILCFLGFHGQPINVRCTFLSAHSTCYEGPCPHCGVMMEGPGDNWTPYRKKK
jgi:hypothetical protein